MRKIKFTKMVASGNDFVIAEIKNQKSKIKNLNNLAKDICNRKFGIGADGLLILEKSKVASIKMRIFNTDGSEAEMCGNGARCVSLYGDVSRNVPMRRLKIETKAGIIESKVAKDNIKIKLTDPRDINLDIPIKVNGRPLKVNFVNTGVPHVVIFVEGLDKINVNEIGKAIRYHKEFAPRGTNVNFIEVLNKDSLRIRTYERGVEAETLACGTGTVASALIFALKSKSPSRIKVHTAGKEILVVYFKQSEGSFKDVWLEGKARIVYQGEYHV